MKDLPKRAEDMFCYAVYTASHMINRSYLPLLKPLGLTYPQYITLTLLWQEDGQSVGSLARKLRMESSTMTPLIKRLETLGFVKRRRGIKDERQVFVYLTGNGRFIENRAPDITACMIEGTGLTREELDQLVATLTALAANLSDENVAD